jgi:hypothetical protein
VTVLTGFLGAGKTTLLRSLLTQANGRRIAAIVNEFGDAGFDGGLVEECAAKACAEGDIVELTNGCICCTVADDFIPTMGKPANPKWLAGVMRHGYKGAFEIAATVDYLFGFSATADAVSDHHFDQLSQPMSRTTRCALS